MRRPKNLNKHMYMQIFMHNKLWHLSLQKSELISLILFFLN